jgi:beta-mannosidase
MERISLNGGWVLREKGKKDFFRARVPGEVHLDLKNNGIIAEPLTGKNFLKLRRLEGKEWIYEKRFRLPARTSGKLEMVFEGIDGNSHIFLNGNSVGSTKNSFIKHTFDVTDYLASENLLTVHLNDGLKSASRKDTEKYYPDSFRKRDMRRILLRKPQFYFGWDWTGRLINCGIWRPVYLYLYRNLAIREMLVYPDISGVVNIILNAENFNPRPLDTNLSLFLDEKVLAEKKYILPPGKNKIRLDIKIKNPELWFPWNTGTPNLYSLRAVLSSNGTVEDAGEVNFGFRKVEIEQKKISKQEGKSFTFRINGKRVFAKGANWIPADTIPARVSREKYRKLLFSAKEMGVNMLRVWGGGIYEDPYFYQLCDSLGIMVWQDFMFACAYYPDDRQDFIDKVRKESETVVKELRNHPSIVLWCGNNENHTIYFAERRSNPRKGFYGKKIFHQLLPRIVKKISPDIPYWPSSDYSPSGRDPKSMREGDRHSWYIPAINQNEYKEKGERYFFLQDRAKFVSEFGRLALSLPSTIKKATGEKKIDFASKIFTAHLNTMWHRLKYYNEKLVQNYGKKVKKLKPKELALLSQIWQGESINFALSYYHSRKFLTSGALFWMYNDSWPTCSSWTATDYYLRKTPLYWYAKRAFAETGIFIEPLYLQGGNLFGISLWNDSLETLNFNLNFGISDFSGNKILFHKKQGSVSGNSVLRVGKYRIQNDILKRDGLIIYARGTIKGKELQTYTPLSVNWRNTFLPETEIQADKKNNREIILKSDRFVIACVLKNVETEDNFFPLLPGISHSVRIKKGTADRVQVFSCNKLLDKNLH